MSVLRDDDDVLRMHGKALQFPRSVKSSSTTTPHVIRRKGTSTSSGCNLFIRTEQFITRISVNEVTSQHSIRGCRRCSGLSGDMFDYVYLHPRRAVPFSRHRVANQLQESVADCNHSVAVRSTGRLLGIFFCYLRIRLELIWPLWKLIAP